MHLDCYRGQPEHMKARCQLCKEPEVSEAVRSMMHLAWGIEYGAEEIEIAQQSSRILELYVNLHDFGQWMIRHSFFRDRGYSLYVLRDVAAPQPRSALAASIETECESESEEQNMELEIEDESEEPDMELEIEDDR